MCHSQALQECSFGCRVDHAWLAVCAPFVESNMNRRSRCGSAGARERPVVPTPKPARGQRATTSSSHLSGVGARGDLARRARRLARDGAPARLGGPFLAGNVVGILGAVTKGLLSEGLWSPTGRRRPRPTGTYVQEGVLAGGGAGRSPPGKISGFTAFTRIFHARRRRGAHWCTAAPRARAQARASACVSAGASSMSVARRWCSTAASLLATPLVKLAK